MSPIEKRIADLERMIADLEPAPPADWPDPSEMTDAECVKAWHRLAHSRPPSGVSTDLDPEQEAEVARMWRELNQR
jgi:hypothetical protein